MTVELSILIALTGCFVGLAGWLAGRDKRITRDAQWRGEVNAKLDVIVNIKSDVAALEDKVAEHGERLSTVESSVRHAHHRLNEINKK